MSGTSHDISPQCYGVISRLRFGGTIEDVQRVIVALSLSLSDSNYQAYTLNSDSNYRSGRRHKGTLGVYIRAYSYRIGSKTQVKCIPNEFTASGSSDTYRLRYVDCKTRARQSRLRMENLVSLLKRWKQWRLSPLSLDLDPLRKPLRINFEYSLDEQDSSHSRLLTRIVRDSRL